MDVIFVVVILYYTAGCARCKGERGENARNMSENADEEWHTAQKRMEIIGFLTKEGERLRGEGGRRPPALRAVFRGLAGACGGGNSAEYCPQKTAERETMLEQQRGYDDIIGLKRPFSRYRRMPRPERAVQFAPFATLTGHEEILQETARPTDGCPRLEEDERSLLDARLQLLRLLLPGRPWVTVTWFEPDGKKAGGTCLTATGQALRLKEEPPRLVFSDGREVLLERVLTLGGDFAGGMPE